MNSKILKKLCKQLLFVPSRIPLSIITLNVSILCREDLGIVGEDMQKVWKILAAILHLGNINFKLNVSSADGGSLVDELSEKSLAACALNLGVAPEVLAKQLVVRLVTSGKVRSY